MTQQTLNNYFNISDNYTKIYNIYTDGSCINKNNKSYAGYGIYIPSKDIKLSKILKGKKTNNRAELSAIIDAINIFPPSHTELNIYTDSTYSILIFTTTGIKYKKKHYKNVLNADLVKTAVELTTKYNLKFKHIIAHTTNQDEHSIGNRIADKLATDASYLDYTNNKT
tara:strand:- start:1892 stop:2395 length:504 start_codon:yes stop_codon:yes gene_type:complete